MNRNGTYRVVVVGSQRRTLDIPITMDFDDEESAHFFLNVAGKCGLEAFIVTVVTWIPSVAQA